MQRGTRVYVLARKMHGRVSFRTPQGELFYAEGCRWFARYPRMHENLAQLDFKRHNRHKQRRDLDIVRSTYP